MGLAAKRHKKRKSCEVAEVSCASAPLCGYSLRLVTLPPTQDEFADLELRSPEINDEPMFNVRSPKVAEQLRDMVIGQRTRGLKFHNERIVDEKIGDIFTKRGAVFIGHRQGVLLQDGTGPPGFAEAVGKSILINFLHVAVPKKSMQSQTRFADVIAQCKDRVVSHAPVMRFLRLLAAVQTTCRKAIGFRLSPPGLWPWAMSACRQRL